MDSQITTYATEKALAVTCPVWEDHLRGVESHPVERLVRVRTISCYGVPQLIEVDAQQVSLRSPDDLMAEADFSLPALTIEEIFLTQSEYLDDIHEAEKTGWQKFKTKAKWTARNISRGIVPVGKKLVAGLRWVWDKAKKVWDKISIPPPPDDHLYGSGSGTGLSTHAPHLIRPGTFDPSAPGDTAHTPPPDEAAAMDAEITIDDAVRGSEFADLKKAFGPNSHFVNAVRATLIFRIRHDALKQQMLDTVHNVQAILNLLRFAHDASQSTTDADLANQGKEALDKAARVHWSVAPDGNVEINTSSTAHKWRMIAKKII